MAGMMNDADYASSALPKARVAVVIAVPTATPFGSAGSFGKGETAVDRISRPHHGYELFHFPNALGKKRKITIHDRKPKPYEIGCIADLIKKSRNVTADAFYDTITIQWFDDRFPTRAFVLWGLTTAEYRELARAMATHQEVYYELHGRFDGFFQGWHINRMSREDRAFARMLAKEGV